ncbi:hypothetical protein E0Z10_g3111 [Xylaria hypoxylon]|uniref:Uncharacterized protein n=1 Tax=Xylaria hypoxylon TaxID=37992 RepID=A0A4Z0YN07_9PEZI|nr:hypothetical protein E0Z10_g3111 [Xylaria hypoxylon]
MNPRSILRRPSWLPRTSDDTYYVGSNAIADGIWDKIFNNLSKYPGLDFGLFDAGDPDTKANIRQRLTYLLPDSNYQYSHDQIAVWESLMASPLTVSNEKLQKVVAMEDLCHASVPENVPAPESQGFFMYSWTMTVFEFDVLVEYLKKEERTVHELVAWDDSIADNKLKLDDQITIRYIGSCSMPEWPNKLMANIYDETEDARSGILAEFLKALLCVLPDVAATRRCHLIQYIITSPEDDEGLHELVHSVLIEFFGASFVLNRHPDNKVSELFTERRSILASLDLGFDNSALEQGLGCPAHVAAKLQDHFKSMEDYLHVAQSSDATGINRGMFQLNEAKCAALLGQSIPRYYKRARAIMIFTARSMHINDYRHGRPFSCSHDPDNQLVGQLLSDFKDLNLRAMCAEPFAYYCLAPWPSHGSLEKAIEFMWDYFKIVKPKSGYPGLCTTEVYLDEAGQPIQRRIGSHNFIHVPLLDPSRCRYGKESVDEAARNFMQTSFANTMVIADKVMEVLDDLEAIEQEMARLDEPDSSSSNEDTMLSVPSQGSSSSSSAGRSDPDPAPAAPNGRNNSEAICSLAMQLYEEFLTTDVGEALCAEVYDDARVLSEVVEKEALFIP